MFDPPKIKVLSLIFAHIFMNEVYLCLGGNIGNREVAMKRATDLIEERVGKITKQSSLYETEAWGVSGQQAYLNCCVGVETTLEAPELMNLLLTIEKELGRERSPGHGYEPRTIDLDILFFNKERIDSEHLTVPHPRLQLRKFVLIPLNEIASNFLHPVLNKTIFNLLGACEDTSDVILYKRG